MQRPHLLFFCFDFLGVLFFELYDNWIILIFFRALTMKSSLRLCIVFVCLHHNVLSSYFGHHMNHRMTPRTFVFVWYYGLSAQSVDPHVAGQVRAERYYHIKTPIGRKSSTMYRFDLVGYSYGEKTPLDFTWVGYPYEKDGQFKQTAAINRSLRQIGLTQYFKDDLVYLRFGPMKR